MASAVGQLLNQYERGRLNRRDLIRGLAMVATAAAGGTAVEAQANDPKLINIDHVTITSANVRKSTEFYNKVLGLNVIRVGPPEKPTCCPDESGFVGVGNDLMIAIRKATREEPAGTIGHFGFRCRDFSVESMKRIIKARGAEFDGNYVRDPDGVRVQLSD